MIAHIKQVVRFGIVGVLNTLIDVGLYWLLTRHIPWFAAHLILTASVTYLIASLNSFICNKYWTFQHRIAYSHQQLVHFYLVMAIAYVVNVFAFHACSDWAGIHDIAAKLIAGISSGVFNFLLQKFWAFRHRPQSLI